MQEAAAVRRAASDAIEDIEPAPLGDALRGRLDEGSMVPGVLTIYTVRALADGASRAVAASDGSLLDPVAKRAAGVQLIYEGLALTRELAHTEPWTNGEKADADLSILAADVLVARGFHLLARTEAADAAVETVRAFGRDQTVREETDDSSLDRNLEGDVLELAAVAGAAMTDHNPTPQLREYTSGLADGPSFQSADSFFPEKFADTVATMVTDSHGSEGVTTSADH